MELKEHFVGKRLQDVTLPAAVVDRAIVRRNCSQMLEACEALKVAFRPHVKTHKVLYGIPIPPSTVRRLAEFGKRLLPSSISVLVDHHDQLQHLKIFKEITGYPLSLFIKLDTGYHRAGVTHKSLELPRLAARILDDGDLSGYVRMLGLYSHAGHSYGGSSAAEAMDLLIEEVENLRQASGLIKSLYPKMALEPLILSVGATPSATSIQNLLHADGGPHVLQPRQVESFRQCLQNVRANKDNVELHAGVYPFLDMQQLATQASPSASKQDVDRGLSTCDIAFTILTEIASIYSERTTCEALIAAGSFALGREPCKAYSGWGIVSNWGITSNSTSGRSGWQVGRISQEHGILDHDPSVHGNIAQLSVGQKIRIYPNHACVAGAAFGWYLVVDSDLPEDRHDEIMDVWARCRGW
ncbi:MAG: hypothetical protein Q9166_000152 [cf. Caloplaca sp. 2 TL-2023]